MINKIHNMDCVEGLRMLPDNSIDLTVTSPPYDNLRTYNGFEWDFETTAEELFRVTKQGGIVVWIVNDATIDGSETGTSFKQALFFKECGFNLHDTMIWHKISKFQHSCRYIPSFEYMFVFSKGKPKTTNIIQDRKNKYGGQKLHSTERMPDGSMRVASCTKMGRRIKEYGSRENIWDIPSERSKITKNHPATFPIQLVKDHIITWSNEGETVLDCFMGSGTTAVACVKNNRNYIGFELSKEYCEIAESRIEEETCQLCL